MADSEPTPTSHPVHDLGTDMGAHVAGFVADREDDARRLASLDALLEVHRRLEDDYVLNAILDLCRQELTRGYEGPLDIRTQAVQDARHGIARRWRWGAEPSPAGARADDLNGASIRACIEALTTMGFTVLELPPIAFTASEYPPSPLTTMVCQFRSRSRGGHRRRTSRAAKRCTSVTRTRRGVSSSNPSPGTSRRCKHEADSRGERASCDARGVRGASQGGVARRVGTVTSRRRRLRGPVHVDSLSRTCRGRVFATPGDRGASTAG